MKVAITQPNYLPWLGYFELLDHVDLWVSLDNVQLSKRSFIVRNKVRDTEGNVRWLSMSVHKSPRETLIQYSNVFPEFIKNHLNRFKGYYQRAPFYKETIEYLSFVLPVRSEEQTVSEYNERLITDLCEYLGISVQCKRASKIKRDLTGQAESKILELCKTLDVKGLYTFKNGIDNNLYQPESFKLCGITLNQQNYRHPQYFQINYPFISHLSVVDLLFNAGQKSALEILRSGRNWKLCD